MPRKPKLTGAQQLAKSGRKPFNLEVTSEQYRALAHLATDLGFRGRRGLVAAIVEWATGQTPEALREILRIPSDSP